MNKNKTKIKHIINFLHLALIFAFFLLTSCAFPRHPKSANRPRRADWHFKVNNRARMQTGQPVVPVLRKRHRGYSDVRAAHPGAGQRHGEGAGLRVSLHVHAAEGENYEWNDM